MATHLKRIKNTSSSEILHEHLQRDGAVIVEDLLSAEQLNRLNSDLDSHIQTAGPGLRHPTATDMIEFYGQSTVRIDGLPAKSETFLEAMLLPQLAETANFFLLPSCKDYLLNTGQLIEIRPGESAQELHFDESAWPEVPTPKPILEIEAMFAITDFTPENGATRVVPGSHRWSKGREARPEEITSAEMKAGSALIYLGTTIHGGGANVTTSDKRRGMFLGYLVGWLRTEENMFLTVPIEKVRNMPKRVQELLGYKPHHAIGVVDVGSPMALLG